MKSYAGTFLIALAITLCGCTQEEGPAEKLGKRVDATTNEIADSAEEVANRIEEAADEATTN